MTRWRLELHGCRAENSQRCEGDLLLSGERSDDRDQVIRVRCRVGRDRLHKKADSRGYSELK